MRINKEYFLPLVEEFCRSAEQIGDDAYPDNGLFIPYTFENYHSAPKKIFYVGRDTAGWVKFDEMMHDYQAGELSNYLDRNSNVVTVQGVNKDGTDEHSLRGNWNTTNKWNFWTYCQKLHLYITKGYTNVNITKLDEEDYQVIEEMGYGNLNSIEHDMSQKSMGIWDKIVDKTKFHRLRLASRKLDRLKFILDAYIPDLVIILNWEERDDIFEGLTVEWHKDYYIEGLRAMYTIEGYDAKILWSNHPNARSISVYDRIKIIGDTAKELLGI